MSQAFDPGAYADLDPKTVNGFLPREETPLDDYTVPTAGDAHHHLFRFEQKHGSTYHPVEVMMVVRDWVNGLSELTGTLPVKAFVKDMPFSTKTVKGDMLEHAGSWIAADHYTTPDSNTPTRWVNPTHVHAERYSDVIVKCECGTLVVHPTARKQASLPHDDYDNHEDCRIEWKYEASARLMRNRREAIERMAYFGTNGSDMYPRLGVTYQGTISHFTETLEIDFEALQYAFQKRRARTFRELLVLFKPQEVGAAYGLAGNTVREEVNEFFPEIDLFAMRTARTRNRMIREEKHGFQIAPFATEIVNE